MQSYLYMHSTSSAHAVDLLDVMVRKNPGATIYQHAISDIEKEDMTGKVHPFLDKWGLKKVFITSSYDCDSDGRMALETPEKWEKEKDRNTCVVWASDDAIAQTSASGFSLYSINPQIAEELQRLPWSPPKEDESTFYAITATDTGFKLADMKITKVPLVPENYAAETVDHFHRAMEAFKEEDPIGRLLILEGHPGSGKSYMVRAMADLLKSPYKFVIVDPTLVNELIKPSLIKLLLNECTEDKKLILVLEDADATLVPRGGDNMSLISALLNMTSGLYGSILDIRVVATTNQRMKSIDPALTRPGRLCAHISVDSKKMTDEEVKRLWEKVTEQSEVPYTGDRTLASVYHEAKLLKSGMKELLKAGAQKKAVGF